MHFYPSNPNNTLLTSKLDKEEGQQSGISNNSVANNVANGVKCSHPLGPAAWSLPALSQRRQRPAPGSPGCSVGTPGPCRSGRACEKSKDLIIVEL